MFVSIFSKTFHGYITMHGSQNIKFLYNVCLKHFSLQEEMGEIWS
jgi:hypothetical protein